MSIIKRIILSILCISMSITLLHPMPIIAVEEDILDEEEIMEITEPEILNEDESQRSEYTKEFIMSDGSTQTIIYPIPVHYEEEGIWEEIDNTLMDDEIAIVDEDSDEVSGYDQANASRKV